MLKISRLFNHTKLSPHFVTPTTPQPYCIAILCLCLVFIASCSQDSAVTSNDTPIRPAKIVTAKSANAATQRIYPGTVEASKKSDLAFRVSGQLTSLTAKSGMHFKQGDTLGVLDDAEYQNAVDDKQAKFDFALSQYEKIKTLFNQKYVSPSDLDEAAANLKGAEAALASARDNLKYTHLKAPFDGLVAHVSVENFQSVRANDVIMQYHNSDSLDIRFNIPESLLGRIKPIEDPSGFCAKVHFNAYPSSDYTACFKEFESVPDQQTRSYSVVLTMPQIQAFQVLPGMAVTVHLDLSNILIQPSPTGAFVPVEAVFEKNGKTWLWKVNKEMIIEQTEVEIGTLSNSEVFIHSGIQAGDSVIAAGVSRLQEGTQVTPFTQERGL